MQLNERKLLDVKVLHKKGERKIWGILFGRKYFLMSLYKMNQKFHYLLFNYITHAFLHA